MFASPIKKGRRNVVVYRELKLIMLSFLYLLLIFQGSATANRCVLLLSFAFLFLFGSSKVNFPGAGALGVLCLGATTAYGWGDKDKVSQ